MNIKEIYDRLILARRPIDFFGEFDEIEELHSLYKEYFKEINPDAFAEKDKYIASEALIMLHRLYVRAINEYDNGVYFKKSEEDEYKKSPPIFQISYGEKRYVFFKQVQTGEISEIYEGSCNEQNVCIKIPISDQDNELIEHEYEILLNLRHQSLPYVEDLLSINGVKCIIMLKIEGTRADDLRNEYPTGIPAEHVLWMIERLLSVVGILHIHNIVHGNIKPENIIINKLNHNVTLIGFSFAISEANLESARYKIVNEFYTADEVGKDTIVEPSTDIFSIGKVAIYLLGGNVEDNSIPAYIDSRISNFIFDMVDINPKTRPNDAWKLYKKLQNIRTEIFGTERFKMFE